jgi:hypothetical protein
MSKYPDRTGRNQDGRIEVRISLGAGEFQIHFKTILLSFM